MSPKQTVVILIFLLGIFAAVLLFAPAEIPQPPQEIVTPVSTENPDQKIDTRTVIKSYGATWDEIRNRHDHDYNVYQMWEWFNNDTTFHAKVENHYGNNSPIRAVIYGGSIEFGVDPATTTEEMDMIYEWLNESADESGLWHIPAKFRYEGKLIIGPAPTVVRTPEYNAVVRTYGATWDEIWEREGRDYDYGRVWNWYHNNTGYQGNFWEHVRKYYGDTGKSPVNRIEYGWTITVLTDAISPEETDMIYSWLNESMAEEGLWGIPVQFKYGGKFTASSENYTVYINGHLTSGITLTAEQNSVVREPPQANHLRSFLLILLTAAVAVVGFSRIIDLPSDPGSRPRKIEEFISEHPGCSQKEIMDATGYSRGSVLYNLRRLEQKKIVRTASYFGSVRYFLRSAGDSAIEMTMKTIMARERPAQLLRMIAESPGIGSKELASRMGICKTTLIWHLDRLLASEVIIKKEDGYQLSCEAESLWEQLNSLETH